MRDRLNLGDFVEFTGRVPDETVAAILSTADVGISPDPKNPLNDLSTMNKTMEYMAFGLPVAAFDLRETRASAAEAGVYATPNQVDELARNADRSHRRRAATPVDGRGGARPGGAGAGLEPPGPRYLSVYDRLLARQPGARSLVAA